MFLIGLTGGIASGKSTVSAIFKELGAPVIDADIIARQVVQPGKPAWKKIKEEFPTVIKDDGSIDRIALGQIIFNDPSKRRILDNITHPYIHRTMMWEVFKCFITFKQFAILDLPLLFESGTMVDYIHKIIVVYCDEEQQIERLVERNQYTKDHAQKRISSQLPIEEKCNKAQFVINNAGSIDETRTQVEAAYQIIKKSKQHWKTRLIIFGWFACIIGSLAWFCYMISSRSVSHPEHYTPVVVPSPVASVVDEFMDSTPVEEVTESIFDNYNNTNIFDTDEL